jgi:hypothetical protein
MVSLRTIVVYASIPCIPYVVYHIPWYTTDTSLWYTMLMSVVYHDIWLSTIVIPWYVHTYTMVFKWYAKVYQDGNGPYQCIQYSKPVVYHGIPDYYFLLGMAYITQTIAKMIIVEIKSIMPFGW